MSFIPTPLQEEKQKMRASKRAARLGLFDHYRDADCQLADVFKSEVKLKGQKIVAGYYPFRGEMSVLPLLDSLRHWGHKIALPVVGAKDAPLIFRLYEDGEMLVGNAMGIREPSPQARAVDPDILLVPLLAFDRDHNRLGYGGGFYDRTITELRARKSILAIGVGYSFQEVPRVPVGATDAKLDKVITEQKIF